MKISISFKAILSSVHKPACFRKQPGSLEYLLYQFSCRMVGLGLLIVDCDLNFRGFYRPVTAPTLHFKLLQLSLKIKYLGTLKYDFSK